MYDLLPCGSFLRMLVVGWLVMVEQLVARDSLVIENMCAGPIIRFGLFFACQ